jgi:hypothetical protein
MSSARRSTSYPRIVRTFYRYNAAAMSSAPVLPTAQRHKLFAELARTPYGIREVPVMGMYELDELLSRDFFALSVGLKFA